ncbi:hypothetical protein ACVWYU_000234 [Pseudomonas sp. TE12234]
MSEILSSEWISQWLQNVSLDKELSHIGKLSQFFIKLTVERQVFYFSFECGEFRAVDAISAPNCDVVEFVGIRDAWNKIFKVVPEPLYNDFLALEKIHPDFSITSDRIYLLRHLRVLQKLFSVAPRRG